MIRVVHPGSGSWFFTHPGSRGQKSTGSRIRKTDQIINFRCDMDVVWYANFFGKNKAYAGV
jgi:hypothetical protein